MTQAKQMIVRLEGALLLALAALALHRIHLLVHAPPAHSPSALELLLGLAAVVAGVCGIAFVLAGPALFRSYPWPPPESD